MVEQVVAQTNERQRKKKCFVQKFGGTSVGSIARIQAVAHHIAAEVEQGHQLVVVVSAMSGETSRLLSMADEISSESDAYAQDILLSTGEQVTVGLLVKALRTLGCPAQGLCGWQVPICTDSSFGKARIQSIDGQHILNQLSRGVLVVAGFQGVTASHQVTTLGRGGSDTTAVAIAATIKADECQIFTDVDGVYTTDPRVEPNARRLAQITFEEMLEMASLGSKVLQIRSVEFAGKFRVPLRVLSSFKPGPGTLITLDDKVLLNSEENFVAVESNVGSLEHAEAGVNDAEIKMEQPLISGIAFTKDEAKIVVRGVPDQPGIAYKILGPVGDANIEVDMIVQNISADKTTDFTFTVPRADCAKTVKLLEAVVQQVGAREVIGDEKIAKVSVVGVAMRTHAGIASKMFQLLAEENINIQLISTSEIKISVVIDEKYMELTVRALHAGFQLDQVLGANV